MSLFGRHPDGGGHPDLPRPEHSGFEVEVRGESFRTAAALSAAAEGQLAIRGDHLRALIPVRLRRERRDEGGAKAIVVLAMTGAEIGHVPREDAPGLVRALESGQGDAELTCEACVYGTRRADGGWQVGVWIAVPPENELRERLPEAPAAL